MKNYIMLNKGQKESLIVQYIINYKDKRLILNFFQCHILSETFVLIIYDLLYYMNN